jgi:AbrB family looped-hinge helix DNA binding protein
MSTVLISPRYRITIPKEVREQSDLKIGDKISFLRKGKEIILVKVPDKPLIRMAGSMRTKKNIRKVLRSLKEEDLGSEKK